MKNALGMIKPFRGRIYRGTTSVWRRLTAPSSRTQTMSIRSNGRARRSLPSVVLVRRFRCAAPGMYFTRIPCRLSPKRRLSLRAFYALLLSDHRVLFIKCKSSLAQGSGFVKRDFCFFSHRAVFHHASMTAKEYATAKTSESTAKRTGAQIASTALCYHSSRRRQSFAPSAFFPSTALL